jgi:hypothetical protein
MDENLTPQRRGSVVNSHRLRINAVLASLVLVIVLLMPAIAAACEGGGNEEEEFPGFLKFTQSELEGVFKIPTGGMKEYSVEYTGLWHSGTMTQSLTGPFSFIAPAGNECSGISINNFETCDVNIKCTGAKGNVGKVEVHGRFTLDAESRLECV